MPRTLLPGWLLVLLLALVGTSAAQAQLPELPALRPISLTSTEAALARLPGAPTPPARTSGSLDLRGRQVYIAEYLLLVDLSGDLPASPRDGKLLGMAVGDGPARLAYRSNHDIAVLQVLADQAWADLQARLAAAGVVLADGPALVAQMGAVHPATGATSSPGAPVVIAQAPTALGDAAGQASPNRRYLVLAPSGMRMAARSATGLGAGDATARAAHAAQRVEGLSLALALNLSALDASGARQPAFAAPGGLPTLSPLMELVPAPSAALVQAHVQPGLVNLAEASQPAAPFGRLRLAPLDGPIPSNDPLKPLLSLGRRLAGDSPVRTVDALLDLDGPATARLAVYLISAANQAIANTLADALKAGR